MVNEAVGTTLTFGGFLLFASVFVSIFSLVVFF